MINRSLPEREYQRLLEVERDRDRLLALINTPELLDFIEALKREVPHQRERWGADSDAGKTPADWYWLLSYLGGKALFHMQEWERLSKVTVPSDDVLIGIARHREKFVHHIITTAAACANWHAFALGLTNMRPGTDMATRDALEACPA